MKALEYSKLVLNILCVTWFVTSTIIAWSCYIGKKSAYYKIVIWKKIRDGNNLEINFLHPKRSSSSYFIPKTQSRKKHNQIARKLYDQQMIHEWNLQLTKAQWWNKQYANIMYVTWRISQLCSSRTRPIALRPLTLQIRSHIKYLIPSKNIDSSRLTLLYVKKSNILNN